MGKSYKKNPIVGNAGNSEKKDKKIANRKFRKKTKQILHQLDDLDNLNAPIDLKEVYNESFMSKDGKQFIDKESEYYKSGKWKRK